MVEEEGIELCLMSLCFTRCVSGIFCLRGL